MEINLKEMGKRIRIVRGSISGSTFGAMLGVSTNMVSSYENGQTWPKSATLGKIIAISGKSADWLLYGISLEQEPTVVAYPLAEDEKRAVHTAEDLLKYKGLDKRFAVVEIHHPPPQEERLSDKEKELLEAFRQVDQQDKDVILSVALAFKQGGGRGRPGKEGSPGANCA